MIENSKNVVSGDIKNIVTGGGDFHIGDTYIFKSAEYKELTEVLTKLNYNIQRVKETIEKYPNDIAFKDELTAIEKERDEHEKKIEAFKREVLKLAEEFLRIPINTDRLTKAKEFFEAGEFTKARTVLETEKELMRKELDDLLNNKEELVKRLSENENLLKDKANEFLILAHLTAINFELPHRFEEARNNFEDSLRAHRSFDNIFAFALFLQEHHQNNEALPKYKDALEISRELAAEHPEKYLPDVAKTLNNLAALLKDRNELDEAQKKYSEALEIRRKLAQDQPDAHLKNIATLLNNLGTVFFDKTNYVAARENFEEALEIYRKLAKSNEQLYLPHVARILSNLGVIFMTENQPEASLKSFIEALDISRALDKSNPQTYSGEVAMTLNNMAMLRTDLNQREEAWKNYEEALEIYGDLAKNNPQTYLPHVATIFNNLGTLLKDMNQLELAKEDFFAALEILKNLARDNPQTYLPDMAGTLRNIGNLFSILHENDTASKYYQQAEDIDRHMMENKS